MLYGIKYCLQRVDEQIKKLKEMSGEIGEQLISGIKTTYYNDTGLEQQAAFITKEARKARYV